MAYTLEACAHEKSKSGITRCADCRAKQAKRCRESGCDDERTSFSTRCTTHIKTRRLQWRFGITAKRFAEMLVEQEGRCAVCSIEFEFDTGNNGRVLKQYPRVDHDHSCCPGGSVKTCGECVRGLLCYNCNVALGLLGDDVDTLLSAITYLWSHTDQDEPAAPAFAASGPEGLIRKVT